jgi:hypothetical protein
LNEAKAKKSRAGERKRKRYKIMPPATNSLRANFDVFMNHFLDSVP